jgi:hypothetical protein
MAVLSDCSSWERRCHGCFSCATLSVALMPLGKKALLVRCNRPPQAVRVCIRSSKLRFNDGIQPSLDFFATLDPSCSSGCQIRVWGSASQCIGCGRFNVVTVDRRDPVMDNGPRWAWSQIDRHHASCSLCSSTGSSHASQSLRTQISLISSKLCLPFLRPKDNFNTRITCTSSKIDPTVSDWKDAIHCEV